MKAVSGNVAITLRVELIDKTRKDRDEVGHVLGDGLRQAIRDSGLAVGPIDHPDQVIPDPNPGADIFAVFVIVSVDMAEWNRELGPVNTVDDVIAAVGSVLQNQINTQRDCPQVTLNKVETQMIVRRS